MLSSTVDYSGTMLTNTLIKMLNSGKTNKQVTRSIAICLQSTMMESVHYSLLNQSNVCIPLILFTTITIP